MQKEAERRILEYQSQLQSLMRDLSLTEERERKQIAADIHDRICQTLAVCQMRLGAVAQSPAPPEAVSRAAHEIGELLDRTIKDTSSLIFELSPPVLHQLGLVAALEWFGEKIQQRHRIRVSVRARDSAQPVPEDQRASLFRAACELINNAVKHAGAKRIWVVLEQSAWCQRIQVIDNGAGFTPAEELGPRDKPGGFGLFHIRERLRGWGGTLEIHSRPGSGTRAVLTAPMDVVPLEK
jgi:signal transduction histidine kinase